MAKPDLSKTEIASGRDGSRWVRRAITLLLLAIVFVTGIVAYSSRQQWWELYLSYIGK